MKQILDLRPVHHRLEERIRAHVILCWLALLLIRILETTTGDTWTTIRRELQRLAVGTFTGPAGSYRQTTDPTPPRGSRRRAIAIRDGLRQGKPLEVLLEEGRSNLERHQYLLW